MVGLVPAAPAVQLCCTAFFVLLVIGEMNNTRSKTEEGVLKEIVYS